MTIEEMRERKRELGLSNRELSIRSGVPVGTLQKILSGETKSPRMAAVTGLESVLARRHGDAPAAGKYRGSREYLAGSGPDRAPDAFHEPTAVYGSEANAGRRQGEYTLDDYYALPDDRRAELIDGVLYDMSAPSNAHQELVSEISFQLKSFVKQNNGSCRVNTAPFDVQLDRDDRTMVQPDILVVCHQDRQRRFGLYGAPDLVVEVVSPATSRKDLTVKLRKYLNAGVREYWVVDPDGMQVIVYKNDEILSFGTYHFTEKIPVSIWEGRCLIDLTEMIEYLGFLNSLPE